MALARMVGLRNDARRRSNVPDRATRACGSGPSRHVAAHHVKRRYGRNPTSSWIHRRFSAPLVQAPFRAGRAERTRRNTSVDGASASMLASWPARANTTRCIGWTSSSPLIRTRPSTTAIAARSPASAGSGMLARSGSAMSHMSAAPTHVTGPVRPRHAPAITPMRPPPGSGTIGTAARSMRASRRPVAPFGVADSNVSVSSGADVATSRASVALGYQLTLAGAGAGAACRRAAGGSPERMQSSRPKGRRWPPSERDEKNVCTCRPDASTDGTLQLNTARTGLIIGATRP